MAPVVKWDNINDIESITVGGVMRIAIAIVLGLVIGVGQSAYSQTQSSPDPSVSDIVQSGKLRIGVFPSFQYSKDASGKPQGLALGIANALAAGMSIREVVTVEYPTPP
jgi:ABC-type amino acid transport substrate-binding protein